MREREIVEFDRSEETLIRYLSQFQGGLAAGAVPDRRVVPAGRREQHHLRRRGPEGFVVLHHSFKFSRQTHYLGLHAAAGGYS